MTIDKGSIDPGGPPGLPGERAAGSPIEFRLDPGSGVPTYLQLAQQVEDALRLGLAQQAELRKALMTWLRSAEAAGLDEDGVVALFTSSLRDFLEHRGAPRAPCPRRGAARHDLHTAHDDQAGVVA